tara:strand:+ start:496 stop:951 length:456 start_codon:yes stop_codon:yes gene_type:complete
MFLYLFKDNMDLPMNIWGPHYWFIIHTVAMNYPKIPGATTKKKYYDFFQYLPLFLPHKKAQTLFTTLLKKYPISPYLDSKESLLKWTHFIHNKVNIIFNKPTMSYKTFYESYHKQFIPKPTVKFNYKQWYKKIAYCLSILFILFTIFLFIR